MLTEAGSWLFPFHSHAGTRPETHHDPGWKYALVHGPAIVWVRLPLPLTPTVFSGHKNYQSRLVSSERLIQKGRLSQDPIVREWGWSRPAGSAGQLCNAAMGCNGPEGMEQGCAQIM